MSKDGGWRAVLERFEQHVLASVMARTVLEEAFPPDCIDDVFEPDRRCQHGRELLSSTMAELMTSAVLGLRPSLHAAAARGRVWAPIDEVRLVPSPAYPKAPPAIEVRGTLAAMLALGSGKDASAAVQLWRMGRSLRGPATDLSC